jgi:single-stranded-DNA-specific exonuclease
MHLEKLNNERKGVVANMVKEAKRRVKDLVEMPVVIVMGNPEWRPSLVGLVANTLAEEFNRPTFLWGRDGKGILKGSCRTDGTISVVRLMEHARDTFLAFGGHHASGGFSVDHKNIHTLPDSLMAAFKALGTEAFFLSKKQSRIDAHITLNDLGGKLIQTLDLFGPFGEGNPKPLFAIQNVTPNDVQVFGKTRNHTKLKFLNGKNRIEAISFFRLPHEFTVMPEKDKPITLLTHIERSYFYGRLEPRLRIVDIV